MIRATLAEAARLLGLEPPAHDARFAGVSTDTRTLAPGALFVALVGPRHDGHDYLGQAAAGGATAALVSRPGFAPLPTLHVSDTRAGLGRLAGAWRRQFQLPLIAVTGSNGKTTVKEMLAAIVAEGGPVLATRGNLNNAIGLPLTLLGLDDQHRCAVVEMGASAAGEIADLAEIARPTVGLITNAAMAHLEGFGSLEGVVRAKGELVAGLGPDGCAVINGDDAGAAVWRELAGRRRRLVFGSGADCDVRLEIAGSSLALQADGFVCELGLETPAGPLDLRLGLAGRHNALNAAAATAAALAAGIEAHHIRSGLARVRPVVGRLQYRAGRQGCSLIDDTYNANPYSLDAALEVLAACPGERWLVLGDMAELGARSADLHESAGHSARRHGIERLYAIGGHSVRAVAAFGAGARHFESHASLVEALHHDLSSDAVVLVKGSRSMRMEQVVAALSANPSPTERDTARTGSSAMADAAGNQSKRL